MKIFFFRTKLFFVSFPHQSQDPFFFCSCCVPALLANWELSSPEAPVSLSTAHGTTHSSTRQLKQLPHTQNNVPELFDVFLASFKALQQLGTRWEARTVGQDPKSIEGIGAFPWIRIAPAHSSCTELLWGLYSSSFTFHVWALKNCILGNEDLFLEKPV